MATKPSATASSKTTCESCSVAGGKKNDRRWSRLCKPARTTISRRCIQHSEGPTPPFGSPSQTPTGSTKARECELRVCRVAPEISGHGWCNSSHRHQFHAGYTGESGASLIS